MKDSAMVKTNEPPQNAQPHKKPYHSPKLRACGGVKERTLSGIGPISDTQWTTASVAS